MSKLIIPIIIAIVVTAGIGGYFIFNKSALPNLPKILPFSQNSQGKCGDGVCDSVEKDKNACPKDCGQNSQSKQEGQQNQQTTQQPATTNQQPSTNQSKSQEQISQDSPFGMHPANTKSSNQYAEAVDMGVKWHRPPMYMFWSLVQKDLNSDKFDFQFYDEYYGAVPDEINILGNIAPDNPKRSKGYLLDSSYFPINEDKYLKFVKAGVERYDGDGNNDMPNLKNPILYWQVGNEPNNKAQLKDFAKLQKITYGAIKEVCSECKVIIGGAAQPIDIFGIKTLGFVSKAEDYFFDFGESYEPYLQELNGSGFDIFDFHWYGGAKGDYALIKPVYLELKKILKKYGFSNVSVWITEMGAYSGAPSDKSPKGEKIFSYQNETEQAGDYLKRFIYPLFLGIKKIFPAFGLIEGFKGNDGYFDHTGFIYDGKGSNDLGYDVKKLSYYTYKKMVEILEGSDWNNIQTIQEKDGVYIYKFTKNSKPIWAAWNDNSAEKQITIANISSSQIKITEAVPKYESGKDVKDYSTAFNTETKSVNASKITITLKDKPVFVEER
ncbi:MAG: hypothetical protein AAB607_02235 [Patescibacteria group bacterium]